MKLTITKQHENKLLDRIEISGEITFEGNTPRNTDVTQQIATKRGTKVELVVVKHVYTQFGHQKVNFDAFVYSTEDAKQKTEVMTKHLKKKAEEKKKKEKEVADAKAEEDQKKAEEAATKEKEVTPEPAKETKEGEQ
ncbi:hypothetical protein COV17_04535 [Candidatus Woesearchaeota archaeon CG10_big_fil_rev_8_21_14_0_10_36_11]|nr:MAG: hypothetical protein COV17_04535 [Candidatus Woesearchaeota archaeon CG10_big_fil_rev_8_21_14_0_10_36_11]